MSDHPKARYSGTVFNLTAAEASNLDERGVPKQLGSQMRRMEIAGYDPETHTVTMAVSSSNPVERYFGVEILSHDKGAIRTGRLDQGLALLYNHNVDDHLGRSQSYELGDPLRVGNRFGPSPLAREKEADVDAKILVDVSLRYMVYEWEITEDKNGVRTYLAVDWEPLEISLVTVPADPTVGVGRSLDKYAAPVSVRSFRSEKEETKSADDPDDDDPDDDEEERKRKRSAEPAATELKTPPTEPQTQQRTQTPMATAAVITEPAVDNQARIASLRSLMKENPTHFSADQFAEAVQNNLSARDAKEIIAESIIKAAQSSNVRSAAETVIASFSEREATTYSRSGSIRASINQFRPGTFGDRSAGFAREVSDAIRKEATERGITGLGDGILLPGILNNRFAAAESQKRTVASAGPIGAATNFTSVDPTPIEMLRSMTFVLKLGARMLPGLHGTPQMPRQNATAASNWLAEGQSVTNSDPGMDSFQMTPHRLSIQNSYYRDFLALSALSIDGFLAEDRYEVLARSLDYAVPFGSGVGPVPLGFINRTGIATRLSGSTRDRTTGVRTAGTGGVAPTNVDLNGMEGDISNLNAITGSLAWATTPKVRTAMRDIPKQPGSSSDATLMPDSAEDGNGLQVGPLGYKMATSTNMPTNFTVNGVSNLHPIILGVFNQILIGDWDLNEIITDNVTEAAAAKYKITEHAYYDTNVRHLECFSVMFVKPE